MEIKSFKYIVLSLILLLVGLDVVMSASSSCDALTEDECGYNSKCTWLLASSCYDSQLGFCALASCVSNKTTCVQSPQDASVFYPIPSTTCLPSGGYTVVNSKNCECPPLSPSQVACANLDAAQNLTKTYDNNDCGFYKTCFITFGYNCDNSTFAICRSKNNNRCVKPGLCAMEPQSKLIYKFDTQCVPNNWEIISNSRCQCS